MVWRSLGALILAFSVAGCATGGDDKSLPLDHPANAEAAITPVPAQSMTLSLHPGGDAVPSPVGDVRSKPSSYGTHAGHNAAVTPNVAAPSEGHLHQHEVPNQENPATASLAPGKTTYACPMHAEVVSTDPNARCPTCQMKINKPKAATAAPATSHAGHEGGH